MRRFISYLQKVLSSHQTGLHQLLQILRRDKNFKKRKQTTLIVIYRQPCRFNALSW